MVSAELAHVSEVGMPTEHFQPGSPILTISDGRGGTLSAVAAVRSPTGDGRGQTVFFWHGRTLVEAVPRFEALGINDVRATAAASFAVTFGDYARSDPMCCPSRFITITYHWDGHALTPMQPEPASIYDGDLRVSLR
jgi:LppP/LprE lipoprotein